MTWILVAFIIKHFICDFPLQVPYHFLNKGKYGHPGGIMHAGIHGVGTLLICLAFSLNPLYALADAVIHYHVDWSKNQINDRYKLAPQNKYFWWLLGADQLAHYLTYVWIVA